MTAVDAPVLDSRDLYCFYHAGDEEVLALRGVSLVVDAGSLVAVVGPSGSGKSTLLACLAGLDDPDGGCVWISGVRMSRTPENVRAHLRATRIGVLLQANNLIEHLSVVDNIALAQRLAGRPEGGRWRSRKARPRPMELLDRVGLAGRAKARPRTLSGGEAARAALAVALANEPPLLLADEPTGELDGDNEQAIVALLADLATRGTAVVVVTHSAAVAAVADRTVHLLEGRVTP